MTECRTIYVDLDDVLCHAGRHFLLIVERAFGKRFAYENLTNFDVGHACGLSPAERDELYRLVHQPEELLSIEPVEEAIAALKLWEDQGFDIAIVTGRPPDSVDASLAWLAKHRISHGSFTVVDKYSRFVTQDPRAISLIELAKRRFCWAVEDSLPMARYLAEHMRLNVALIDRPWNQCGDSIAGIYRYHDWSELAASAPLLAVQRGER
ncbi:MAG TPA: bifunctional metallophosphatase/5'-nucleotidase [Candidatus Binatia bacterium]|nr:bifunctional metallophosphatase/5'-nucleotidase [Candidatus Binatia bacterium]